MLAVCIILSSALTMLLLSIIKIKASNWVLLPLGLITVVIPYLLNPYLRVYSSHGFMHLSIVYQIIDGNIPPNNTLLAGVPLLYPWGHHLLTALISSGFIISPQNVFALLNICSLMLTMILAYKTAKALYSNRIASVFAVLLSIFGITFVNKGPIAEGLYRFFSIPMFIRPTPVLNKFMGINSNSLGLLFFALFLFSVIHIFSNLPHVRRYYCGLVCSVLGVGFFYPVYLPAIIATCFVSCIVIYFRQRGNALPKIVGMITCVALSIMVLLPFLIQIGSGKSEAAIVGLTLNFHQVYAKSVKYFLTVLPVSILLFAKRNALFSVYRTKANEIHILICAIISTALLYIFVSAPLKVEYKYLILSCFSLGILSSICLQNLYTNHKVVSFLLISSFLIPMSYLILNDANANDPYYHVLDEFIEDGMYLRHSDPSSNAMYTWIKNETEHTAVFIDTHTTIPVFAQRQLYVGLDIRRDNRLRPLAHDGWGLSARTILKRVNGHPQKIIDDRKRAATKIYSDLGGKLSEDVFLELNRIGDNDIYIVARDLQTNKRLLKDEHFNKVFAYNEMGIYKYRK